MQRRHFLTGVSAIATAASLPATLRAQSRPRSTPTIDVKKMGAFGNGKLPDARQIRAAIDEAKEHPGGATVYFPPGEYYLGAADDSWLVTAQNASNLRFVGEKATITCRSVNGSSSMLVLAGCRNITVEGLHFRDIGLNRQALVGAAAVRLANDETRGCDTIEVRDCTFESVVAGVISRSFDETRRARIRGVTLSNLAVSRSIYGFNFQDAGDDVTGRRLRCVDCMRSYFPYGVSRHDIELDTSNNATKYTDVIISCYTQDTTDIRLRMKLRAKRGGDAIVNLDHNNDAPNKVLRNIRVDVDIDDVDCGLDTVFLFRARDKARNTEQSTTRRWEAISLDGDVKICDKTKLFEWESVAKTPGTLFIGPRLARNPRLPRSFPGFNAKVAPT